MVQPAQPIRPNPVTSKRDMESARLVSRADRSIAICGRTASKLLFGQQHPRDLVQFSPVFCIEFKVLCDLPFPPVTVR